jgi:colicin import membrane protein
MPLRRLILQSGLFSITLHLALLGMLVLSFDFSRKPLLLPTQTTDKDIVKAVTVESKQVEQELQKIKDAENKKLKKQQALEKKLKDLEQKTAKVERRRKTEEKRLAEAKKKQQQEQKQRVLEQQKLAQLKQKQQELEKKRKLEEDRKKAEEAEKKRKEEERKRAAEEEQKRKAREQALKQQLAEEQRQREAAQVRQDQQMLQSIAANIYRRVVNNFNKSGLPPGLECELTVRTIPGGEVVNVSISKSSGNDIFDRRAMAAVEKASPLPLPEDAATFDRLKLRQIAFRFRPED